MERFVKESRIRAPREAVFAFHERPDALELLIPPWERVTLIERPGSLRPGSRVVMKTRLGPLLWVTWIAEHTEFDPGRLFADRQLKGPFRYWYHRHLFLDDGRGGTILRDEVDYRPPFGALGRLLGGKLVRSKLTHMFDYRHETTRQIVEAGQAPSTGQPDSPVLAHEAP